MTITSLGTLTAPLVCVLIVCGCSVCGCSSQGGVTNQDDAVPGSEISAKIRSLDLAARESVIYHELTSGHTPSWMDDFQPVSVTRTVNGVEHTVTFSAAVDYFTVGTDDDPFLVPLSPQMAQRVADHYNASLPTRRMVDDIWNAADVKLAPQPIPPSDAMTTVPVFVEHNNTVQEQKKDRGVNVTQIVAGQKKDVVLSNRLTTQAGKVAIYGWHQLNGNAIQPLYTGHTDQWVDYSHGIRLVGNVVTIDGVAYDLVDVLTDAALAPLLSDEGAMTFTRYPTE